MKSMHSRYCSMGARARAHAHTDANQQIRWWMFPALFVCFQLQLINSCPSLQYGLLKNISIRFTNVWALWFQAWSDDLLQPGSRDADHQDNPTTLVSVLVQALMLIAESWGARLAILVGKLLPQTPCSHLMSGST